MLVGHEKWGEPTWYSPMDAPLQRINLPKETVPFTKDKFTFFLRSKS